MPDSRVRPATGSSDPACSTRGCDRSSGYLRLLEDHFGHLLRKICCSCHVRHTPMYIDRLVQRCKASYLACGSPSHHTMVLIVSQGACDLENLAA